MTKATFRKKEDLWTGFEISGHSGYSSSGSDIVCAGISTAVIMSINLIDKLIPNSFEVIQDEKKGYISLRNIDYLKVTNETKDTLNVIFETLVETLESIEQDYPKNLKVKIENNL